MPPTFQVDKWYADVVDEATGDLAICYHSALRWRWLRLRYFDLLFFQGRKRLQSFSSFWQHPSLGAGHSSVGIGGKANLQAGWQRRNQQPTISERLLDTPHGFIHWHCLLPAANAQLRADYLPAPLHGLGYAECLTFTLKPWRMPIRTLRWGRFLTSDHAVVWIHWEGPEPRNLIFHNGHRYPDGLITDTGLRFGSFRLDLTERATLREGPLIRTVFRRSPWLRAIFPARILNLAECKWQTRGRLYHEEQLLSTGWTIHERVDWP